MAGWFNTQVPTGLEKVIANSSPLSAMSSAMSNLSDIVDNRVKEQYTTSALDSLKGITNTKDYLDAASRIDYTKLNKEGISALDRMKSNIAMAEEAKAREFTQGIQQGQFDIAKAQEADRQQALLKDQITNEVYSNWKSMTPEQQQQAMQYSGLDAIKFQNQLNQEAKAKLDASLTRAQIAKANAPKEQKVISIYSTENGKEIRVGENEANVLINNGEYTTIKPSVAKQKGLSKDDKAFIDSASIIDSQMKTLEAMAGNDKVTDSQYFGLADSTLGKLYNLVGMNTKSGENIAKVSAISSNLLAGFGKAQMAGVLTNQDMDIIKEQVPSSSDSEVQARVKIKFIRDFFREKVSSFNSRMDAENNPQFKINLPSNNNIDYSSSFR